MEAWGDKDKVRDLAENRFAPARFKFSRASGCGSWAAAHLPRLHRRRASQHRRRGWDFDATKFTELSEADGRPRRPGMRATEADVLLPAGDRATRHAQALREPARAGPRCCRATEVLICTDPHSLRRTGERRRACSIDDYVALASTRGCTLTRRTGVRLPIHELH
jgi:hypothetical protein